MQGGNAHFGGDLYDAVEHRVVIVLDCGVVVLVEQIVVYQLMDSFKREIRIDRAGAVGEKRCEVMHLARLAALQNDRERRPFLCCDQVLVQRGNSEQGRDREAVLVHSSVGENEDIRAAGARLVSLDEQAADRLAELGVFIVKHRDDRDLEARELHFFQLQKSR